MKSMISSHKENKRYLLVHGQGKNLKENIEKAILEFAGKLGMSKCGLSHIKYQGNQAVICVNREAVDLVRASMVVFPEKIEVLKISGTLKGLKKKGDWKTL